MLWTYRLMMDVFPVPKSPTTKTLKRNSFRFEAGAGTAAVEGEEEDEEEEDSCGALPVIEDIFFTSCVYVRW